MVAVALTQPTRRKDRADSLADVVRALGGISLNRILMRPAPGSATERDVIRLQEAANKRLCELVDGVLVEKAMGFYESRLAAVLVFFIETFLEKHDLGFVLGPDGLIRFFKGLVRLPDVAFFPWRLFPNRLLPGEKILSVIPELAVEILSGSNTPKEMARKLSEYFNAGVKLVWEIDPETRTARVYTSPKEFAELRENDSLDGADVLPGFRLVLRKLFDRAGKREEPKSRNGVRRKKTR